MSERRFLFLQGPLSPLFNRLGHRLKTEGYSVFRINFNVGDWLHWHGENCYSFRGKVEQWSEYLQQFIEDNAITDLVLHGDRRVYHKMAIHIAKQNDLYISVTELGILRPGWLTIERDGLGLLSHFPNEAQYLLDQAQHLPEPLKSKAYSYTARIDASKCVPPWNADSRGAEQIAEAISELTQMIEQRSNLQGPGPSPFLM